MSLKSRRNFLKYSLSSIFLFNTNYVFAKNNLVGSRFWPSESYTRITIESLEKLGFKYFFLTNPYRLVVDIEGVEVTNELSNLSELVGKDKYVSSIRVAINRPNVSRLVFELKEKIEPNIFTLSPIQNYANRLVIDLKGEKVNELKVVGEDKKQNKKKKYFIVALDAGHGGEDPGAIGENKTYEKNITLAVAKKLKRKIDEIPGFKAVLTRDGDYFIPLYERIQIAKNKEADIFISIHADAVQNRDAKGSSVYMLSEKGASSASTKWLEEKENLSDIIGGINFNKHEDELKKTLLDLSLTANMSESKKLASSILDFLKKVGNVHKEDVESAGFAVLKSPTMPSVLIETAFISNPSEERKLKSNDFQEILAEAICEGVQKFKEKYYFNA